MSWSESDKASALAWLDALNGNLSECSRRTGVPHTTLRDWKNGDHVNSDVAEKRDDKKRDMADACEATAWLVLNSIDPNSIESAPLNHRTTAFGTLVDKMQLLRNKPTVIVGDDTPDDEILAELKALFGAREIGDRTGEEAGVSQPPTVHVVRPVD